MYIKYIGCGGARELRQITSLSSGMSKSLRKDDSKSGSFAEFEVIVERDTGYETEVIIEICLFDSPEIAQQAFDSLCEAIANGQQLFDATPYQKISADEFCGIQ